MCHHRTALGRGPAAVLAAFALALWGVPLSAQQASAPEGGAEAVQAIDLAPPSPTEAMSAFTAVEQWVRAMRAPEQEVATPGTRSACVVLRLDHEIVGRGVSLREDGAGVWEAARLAIDEARGRIPVANDATGIAQLKDAAARIVISLELGGRMVPLRANMWSDIDAAVNVAMDGVAARVLVGQEERAAATFPSAMRLRGDAPSAGITRAVGEASGDPTLALPSDPKSTPKRLREERGVRLFRFRVTHLAQAGPQLGPTFLYRGARLIQGAEIRRDGVDAWSAEMTRHLARRTTLARYDPVADKAAGSPMAPELAIAIRGLERRLARPGLPAGTRDEAAAAIATMRARLTENVPTDTALSPMSAAALVLAGAIGDGAPGDGVRQRVADALGAAATDDGQWSPTIAPAARGFIAWALVEHAASRDGADREAALARAQRAVRSIYRDTHESDLVGQMPWLLYAERTLARGNAMVPAAATLRNVRDLVVQHQLTPADAGDEGADLVGGVIYTRQGAALPTAQSSRAIAFLCGIIGDARITAKDESLAQLSHALAGARFLRQLTMDESSAIIAKRPQIALGGVQAAAWDPAQPIEATAISLLAACELLDSLDQMAQAPAPTPP